MFGSPLPNTTPTHKGLITLAKHTLTTEDIKARIYTMRQVRQFLKADAKLYRVESVAYDRVNHELADLRHIYYGRPDRDQAFVNRDVRGL